MRAGVGCRVVRILPGIATTSVLTGMLRLLLLTFAFVTLAHAQLSPEITVHPVGQHAAPGGSVTFSVSASGSEPLSYAWFRGLERTPFASGPQVTLNNLRESDRTVYYARVSNAGGSADSRAAQLEVVAPGATAPAFVGYSASTFGMREPASSPEFNSYEFPAGGGIELRMGFSGALPMTFQWRRDGVPLPGQTNSQLFLENMQVADSGVYTLTATNSRGSATSPGFRAIVRPNPQAPFIVDPPITRQATLGAPANLRVRAVGTGPITYQWERSGQDIAGATNATLVLPATRFADTGFYRVRVSNPFGVTEAGPASIALSNPPRLTNLAVRSRAGTGTQALLVGFTLGGEVFGSAPFLLVRGVGPALAPFGVSDALADPRLDVISTLRGVMQSNDNWGGSSTISSAAAAVGAFPFLDPASRDAAVLTSFSDGGYTVQIQGAGGATGVALAEIYDTTETARATTFQPRLINLSARTHVGTGGDILIAGFAVAGSGPKTLLIRGIGPGLTQFGLTGVLADPKLALFSGTTLLEENDNWSGSASLAAAATGVGAFSIPAESRDAVLLVTVPPGSYSAQVSGVGNTTGVALVEVYEVR